MYPATTIYYEDVRISIEVTDGKIDYSIFLVSETFVNERKIFRVFTVKLCQLNQSR